VSAERFIFRKEYFGALLYDKANWGLKMLNKNEAAAFLSEKKAGVRIFSAPNKGFLSAPLKAFVSISASCNLNCGHCMISKKRTQTEEIDFDGLKSVFEQLGRMGMLEIRLGGYEPTARKDFEKIFEEAKKNGLTISINTNGVCSDDLRKRLAESCVDRVHVSLDGLEKNHDIIRGKGSFAKAIDTIHMLKEKGKYVRIVTCLYRENLKDIKGLVALAENLGCDIKFSPIAKLGSAEHMGGLLTKEECEALKKRFDSMKGTVNIFFNYGTMSSDFIDYCDISDFDSTICGAGRTQLRVENNGEVIMAGCGDLLSDIKPLGTYKDSFPDMWKKSQLVMAGLMKKNGPKCASCGMDSVFAAWLLKPTPAFNFAREQKDV